MSGPDEGAPAPARDCDASAVLGGRRGRTGRARVKPCDFRLPEILAEDQLESLRIVHADFCLGLAKRLSFELRSLCSAAPGRIEQLTFARAAAGFREPFVLAVMEPLAPASGGSGAGQAQAGLLLDPSLASAAVDRLLGGSGLPGPGAAREITDLEYLLLEDLFAAVLPAWAEAWKQLVVLEPRLARLATKPEETRIAPPTEAVLRFPLELGFDGIGGGAELLVPLAFIEPFAHKLKASYWYGPAGGKGGPKVGAAVREIPLDLELRVDAGEYSLERLAALDLGELVVLGEAPATGLYAGEALVGTARLLEAEADSLALGGIELAPGAAEGDGAAEGLGGPGAPILRAGSEAALEGLAAGQERLAEELRRLAEAQEALVDRVDSGPSAGSVAGRVPTFDDLAEIPSADLAAFLEIESPQAGALLCAELPEAAAARLLAAMDEGRSLETARRLSSIEPVKPRVAERVARLLAKKLLGAGAPRRGLGQERLAALVELMPQRRAQRLRDGIARVDPALAAALSEADGEEARPSSSAPPG